MGQRWTLKVLIQQGGLANAFARARMLVHPTTGQPDQRAGGEEEEREWEKVYLTEFKVQEEKCCLTIKAMMIKTPYALI